MPKSKAKDIHLYARAFFRFKTPSQIKIKPLAAELNVSEARLTGMLRAAQHNQSIVEALIDAGYNRFSIPEWFALPNWLRREIREKKKKSHVTTTQTAIINQEYTIPEVPAQTTPVFYHIPQQQPQYQSYFQPYWQYEYNSYSQPESYYFHPIFLETQQMMENMLIERFQDYLDGRKLERLRAKYLPRARAVTLTDDFIRARV